MSKKLGQHFLRNKNAIKKIIASLELKNGENIIEIGPGMGALTIPLAEECQKVGCKIIGIEKDPRLVDWLISELVNWTNIKIIKGDALKDLKKLTNQLTNQLINYKIVGNIPYYITGKLLRILSELENKPELIVLTIQKEVAERIVAHPPKMNPTHRKCSMCGMNLLAAATQFWAESKIIGYLKPSDFSPPPKVESTIIKIIPFYNKKSTIVEKLLYFKLIKMLFKQPRKTILNNLYEGLEIPKKKIEAGLQKIGLSGQERPQNLNIQTILKITNLNF